MATKKQKIVLETGQQCRSAIREIRKKTDWSLLRLAKHMETNYEALRKVEKGFTRLPGPVLSTKLADALAYARAMP